MNNVYAYIRVSTVKQGTKGVSLQEQKSAITDYARIHNLKIIEWFEERETAAKQGRPVFSSMLNKLRKKQAEGVVIHKIDRSARNLKDWATLGELLDSGIDVHFANESIDLRARGGRLSADIQAVIAADFIRNLREETKKGMYGRLKQGLYPLPAPIGYLDTGSGKPKLPDSERAPLIRKAFELYATGKYSLTSLGKELAMKGLVTKAGKNLSRSTLAALLRNPFYIGLIKLKSTGEVFEGIHKPLISKSTFDKVQAVLNGKKIKGKGKHDFLFRVLFKCPECGCTLTGEKQKGSTYYRCHSASCKGNCVNEKKINETLEELLKPFDLCEHEIQEVDEVLSDQTKQEQSENIKEKKIIELSISNTKAKLDRLTDSFIEGDIDREIYLRKKEEFLNKNKELEEKLRAIGNNGGVTTTKMWEKFELLKSLYSSYSHGLIEEKQDMLKIVTSNREVSRKNVMVKLNSPFQELSDGLSVRNCCPCRTKVRTQKVDSETIRKATLKSFC